MSLPGHLDPGMPERGGFADMFHDIQRRLRALEVAKPGALSGDGTNAYLKSGDFVLSEDGSIIIRADDGQKLAEFDKDAVTFFDTNENPLTVLNRSGVTVGSDVVLDADGLTVIGGLVSPIWPARENGSASDVSITTSQTDFLTRTLNPPDWVETLFVMSIARLRIVNVSGSAYTAQIGVTNDDGGAGEDRASSEQNVPHNSTQAIVAVNSETIALSPAGRSVDVVCDALVNSGSNSDNSISLSVIGFGLRNP